jgi:hypothetical protein
MENSIRLALCARLLEKANIDLPVEALRNKDFKKLEDKIAFALSLNTLKRLFAQKGFDDCQEILGRQGTREKVVKFLEAESWDLLMLEIACEINPKKMAKYISALQKRK